MLKTKIAFYGIALPSLVLTTFHFVSHGYVWVEKEISRTVLAQTDTLLKALAASIRPDLSSTLRTPTLPEIINQEAAAHGIKPELIEALIQVESANRPEAIRYEPHLLKTNTDQGRMLASSHGLMQVLGTWANTSVCPAKTWSELYFPQTNIKCGTAILADALKNSPSVYQALVTYNGGAACSKNPKCAAQAHGYATKVLTALAEKMLTSQ